MATRSTLYLALSLMLVLVLSACNLSGAPSEEDIAQTATAALTQPPTRTPLSTSGVPTTIPLTQQSTPIQTFTFPTAIVVVPTRVNPTSVPPPVFPTATPYPVSIVMLSPVPGNVVAGNVQILGSAIHPQFLQYQVEFGPDPNGANLWYTATPAITTPVLNGLLGIWNTTVIPDGRYQLRLRVYLRDGTLLTTVVNNITVQNRINTPVPSPTQNIPRPIAAFTQDKASGDVPLTVRFTNQSSGTINVVSWNFGDGNTSSEVNPTHTFGLPGLYNVTLTVTGPGGSSNVSRQINATSPTAPVAGFTQDRTSGLTPLTVQFTDQSTGNIIAWNWNFSDGSTSSERNPSHTFTVPGTYNVFLTVSGPGGSSSVTRQITVTSATPPTNTPSLTPSSTPTFTPTFTNTTTVVPPTATFTPTVTFTPSQTETIIPIDTSTFTPTTTTVPPTATFTPTFTETATTVPPTATFTPTATSTDLPPEPQASFVANAVPGNPLTIQFTNQSSGQNLASVWDFGDGSEVSSEPNPQHTYASGGTYNVRLIVTDDLGRSAMFDGQVSLNEPGVPNFTYSVNNLDVAFSNASTGSVVSLAWDFGDGTGSSEQNPTHSYASANTYNVTLTVTDANGVSNSNSESVTVSAPLVASFTASTSDLTAQFDSSGSSGAVAGYIWDFGDGQPGSNEANPQHTFPAAGTYTVTLVVMDNQGNQSQPFQQPVTVTAPLTASFNATPTDLTVTFDSSASTGSIAGYIWDFGDGSGANDANPQHTYASAGSYNVTLVVTDNQGGQSQPFSQQVTVSAPLVASFTASTSDLTASFDSSGSTGSIAGYIWDFGDGSGSNDANPSHSYATAGTYNVTLVVTDNQGSQSQPFSQPVTVSAPLTASFTAAPQPDGLTVQFTDASTGAVAGYTWDFGDGSGSNDANPQHTYAGAGTYNVTLTVMDNQGNPSQPFQQPVTVTAPLTASFNATPTDLTVTFDSSASTGSIAGFIWDFGDGSGANDANPQHTYASAGAYNVTLIVTDNQGNQSQPFQQQVTVSAAATQPQQPTLVDTTPVLPNINALSNILRGIYTNGINMGLQAPVFAKAGDSIFTIPGVLDTFAPGGQYGLGGDDSLQAIIDFFNTGDLGGQTSFNRTSLAVNPGFTANDLLDPSRSDPSCNGSAPLICELQLVRPAVMFVAIGTNDARNGTDPGQFQQTLNQIVGTIASTGTIPVLMTVPDDSSNPNTAAINDAIITVAQQNNVPLINIARALRELPSVNMDTSPNGPGALGNNAVTNYGVNTSNYNLLQVLRDLRNIVFPDA